MYQWENLSDLVETEPTNGPHGPVVARQSSSIARTYVYLYYIRYVIDSTMYTPTVLLKQSISPMFVYVVYRLCPCTVRFVFPFYIHIYMCIYIRYIHDTIIYPSCSLSVPACIYVYV